MVFKWKETFYTKVDAEVAGNICHELEKENRLTASNLVDVSRPKEAPLHDYFEWNNKVAAEKYREEQARHLIANIVLVSEEEEIEAKPIKLFHTLNETKGIYEDIRTILASPEKTNSLLEQARRDLVAFKNKYDQLVELASVNNAISNYLKEVV